MKNKVFIFALFLLFLPVKSYAFALTGSTYPIVEPSLLSQILRRARKIEEHPERTIKKLKKKVLHYKPDYYNNLSPAQKSYVFYHDPVYTLPVAIPKVKGGKVVGVLYPKGFKFHVLKYLPFDFPTIVIFDMRNKYQRRYAFDKYDKDVTALLFTTSGDLHDIIKTAKKFDKMVYTNINVLDRRFGVKNTVSVVTRSVSRPDDFKVRVIGIKYLRRYYLKTKK